MKNRVSLMIRLLIIAAMLLGACSSQPETATPTAETEAIQEAAQEAPQETDMAETMIDAEAETAETDSSVALDTSYGNAASVAAQLMLGTIKLEDSDLVATSEQASDLLPLWIEFRTVSFSRMGPGAAAEESSGTESQVAALAAQIQDVMTADQIAAIADMQLTQESIFTLMQEQGITLGFPMGAPPEGGDQPEGGQAPEGDQPQQPSNGAFPEMPSGDTFVPPEVIDSLIQLLADVSGEEVALETILPGAGFTSENSASIDCDTLVATPADSDADNSDAVEGFVRDNNTNASYELATTFSGSLTSFTQRADDFSIGDFICDGQIVSAPSILSESTEAVSALMVDLTSDGTGFTPIYASGEETTLSLSGTILSSDSGDGMYVSDFTGAGSQIVASNYAEVTVDEMTIETDGFMRDAFIVDNHAEMLVTDSTVTTMGANPLTEAYSDFENNANLSTMIATPWVLGIQGGVRLANVLGNNATLSVIDSELTSGGWAVLSIDSGTNSVLNVVDSTLSILPESEGGMSSGDFSYSGAYGSGYGSYIIGNASQNFYGVEIDGTTYGAILTGGSATYQSSNGSITLDNADGETIGTYEGDNQPSTIDAVFGFMSHNNGTISVLDGTEINAQEAIFLYKAGDVTFNADNASLNSNSGIIFQMIDNDDSSVGLKDTQGVIFNTTFSEDEGWPSENGNVTDSGGQGNNVNLNLTNGTYTGNIYNGTGYYGQSSDSLNVTLGDGAILNGDISLTETRHVDENGQQNTNFTIEEYYYLGHVANRAYNNQSSQIAVTLSDSAVWVVTDTSYITSLTVGGGTIQTEDGKVVLMTVNGVETPIESGKTYTGNIVIRAS